MIKNLTKNKLKSIFFVVPVALLLIASEATASIKSDLGSISNKSGFSKCSNGIHSMINLNEEIESYTYSPEVFQQNFEYVFDLVQEHLNKCEETVKCISDLANGRDISEIEDIDLDLYEISEELVKRKCSQEKQRHDLMSEILIDNK